MRRRVAGCVPLCDLDRFKGLNDRHGHQAGDGVLRAVADTLGRESRTTDAVYRYGGEELLVLLAEQTLEGALVVCERMREAVQALGLPHADNEAGVVTIRHRSRGMPAYAAAAQRAVKQVRPGYPPDLTRCVFGQPFAPQVPFSLNDENAFAFAWLSAAKSLVIWPGTSAGSPAGWCANA